jgi:hypothetical protein
VVLDPLPLAGILAAGGNAVVPDVPAVAGSGKALLQIDLLFQGFQCKITETPPFRRLLFHVRCMCCLVKYITNHRKFQI